MVKRLHDELAVYEGSQEARASESGFTPVELASLQ